MGLEKDISHLAIISHYIYSCKQQVIIPGDWNYDLSIQKKQKHPDQITDTCGLRKYLQSREANEPVQT